MALPQAEGLNAEFARSYRLQVLVLTGFSGKGLLSRYPVLGHEQLALYPERPDLRVTVDVEGTVVNVLVLAA